MLGRAGMQSGLSSDELPLAAVLRLLQSKGGRKLREEATVALQVENEGAVDPGRWWRWGNDLEWMATLGSPDRYQLMHS